MSETVPRLCTSEVLGAGISKETLLRSLYLTLLRFIAKSRM